MLKHFVVSLILSLVALLLVVPVHSETETPIAPLPTLPTLQDSLKPKEEQEKRQVLELGGPDIPRFSPFDAVVIACEDAKAVALANDTEVPIQYVRYLSLHNLNKAERIKMKQTIDFTLNSLSRKRRIMRAAGLPNNVIDPLVIRVNLADYGISPKAWDELIEKGSGDVPLPEPYFHKPIMVATEVDEFEDEVITKTEYKTEFVNGISQQVPVTKKVKTGKKIKTGRKIKADDKTRRLAAGSWLALKDKGVTISKLVAFTQTKNPIAMADWFAVYAWWAPAYYTLLGLDAKGNIDQWNELVNFDRKRAARSIIAAITDTKIVTQHNRFIHRFLSDNGYTSGYMWQTNDTAKGVDLEYYLNAIGQFDKPKIAATERIGTLINTLQAYALTDADGNLLNLADPHIAIHSDIEPTKLVDKQVYTGRNCVFCHKKGIYPIKDKVRNLSQKKIAMLISKIYPEYQQGEQLDEKIHDAFDPSVAGVVAHDQVIYTMAVYACNGLAPEVNASQLEMITWTYHDGPITMERAAWGIGWPVEKLDAALRIGVNIDPTLTGFLQEPPELPAIQVWESQGYFALQDYVTGLEILAIQKGCTLDDMLAPFMKKGP